MGLLLEFNLWLSNRNWEDDASGEVGGREWDGPSSAHSQRSFEQVVRRIREDDQICVCNRQHHAAGYCVHREAERVGGEGTGESGK